MATKKKEEFPAFTNAQGIAIVNEFDMYDFLPPSIWCDKSHNCMGKYQLACNALGLMFQ